MAQPVAGPVLVLNSGSSSLKFAVVDPATGARSVTGLAERLGTPEASAQLSAHGDDAQLDVGDGTHTAVLGDVLDAVEARRIEVTAVGHRVVHGGPRFTAAVRVDDDVLTALEDVTELAPLHVPANVAGIRAVRQARPDVPQVAVFDTAFHATMPPRAYRYAVPTAWFEDHDVRRYGFHGTSHRYVSERAAELLGRPADDVRLVTAHLGNGASAAAVRDGRSVDTTMGLTPLEGLVMGTRSGDLDPGVLGYVSGRLDRPLEDLLADLNSRSGLLGLSGRSNDFRTVSEAAAGGDADAQLAVDVFTYRLAKYVAALVVPLGRLDALVFTGGIGEHAAGMRSAVLDLLGFLGLRGDPEANKAHGADTAGRISVEGQLPVALVVPTDEELVIARDTVAVLAAGSSS